MKTKVKPVEDLIAEVRGKMEARKETAADVARYLGRNYQQVWEWINRKKGNPTMKNLLILQNYLELPDRRAGFK